MTLTIAELRKAADLLFNHLEKSGHDQVTLDVDEYWSIPPDQRHNPYEQPSELSIGSLSDDLEEIRAMASGRKDAIGYGLVWLSSVLRAVGEKVIE